MQIFEFYFENFCEVSKTQTSERIQNYVARIFPTVFHFYSIHLG